ncbi:uncharacterized protein [Henckelia pumila]|uniref:uncharacterized protein n=1 Tax=Henckelia pumila TaxID=405737 RepID=UPI003C6E9328
MPSGSKKRKAARKKKENQSVSNHSDGDDDVKQQDDKDSDVGELSSPTSQDHNGHQDLLTEGGEEEIEKGENTSHTPAEESLKTKDSEEPSIVVEDDVVVPVDREFEIEDKSSKKADGNSSRSSSRSSSGNSSDSSSDDESHCIKKGEAAKDIAPVLELGNGNESFSAVPAENIVGAEIDDGVDSVVENFPTEELKNISTLGDKVETDTSISPFIIEPIESEEKRLGFVEDNGSSTVIMDVPLKRKDESIENIVAPDIKECVTQESHDIGVELEKDSGVTEVLLVPAPRPVQTTWKSCCGLFEVFSRSGR